MLNNLDEQERLYGGRYGDRFSFQLPEMHDAMRAKRQNCGIGSQARWSVTRDFQISRGMSEVDLRLSQPGMPFFEEFRGFNSHGSISFNNGLYAERSINSGTMRVLNKSSVELASLYLVGRSQLNSRLMHPELSLEHLNDSSSFVLSHADEGRSFCKRKRSSYSFESQVRPHEMRVANLPRRMDSYMETIPRQDPFWGVSNYQGDNAIHNTLGNSFYRRHPHMEDLLLSQHNRAAIDVLKSGPWRVMQVAASARHDINAGLLEILASNHSVGSMVTDGWAGSGFKENLRSGFLVTTPSHEHTDYLSSSRFQDAARIIPVIRNGDFHSDTRHLRIIPSAHVGSVFGMAGVSPAVMPRRQNNLASQGNLLHAAAQATSDFTSPFAASVHGPIRAHLGPSRQNRSPGAAETLPTGRRTRTYDEVLDLPPLEEEETENYDLYGDMRLDVDNMSYEELLALGERIGNVKVGLSDDAIVQCLQTSRFSCSDVASSEDVQENESKCSICQDEYVDREELGKLHCGHSYHADCIRHWLEIKNECPICKNAASNSEL